MKISLELDCQIRGHGESQLATPWHRTILYPHLGASCDDDNSTNSYLRALPNPQRLFHFVLRPVPRLRLYLAAHPSHLHLSGIHGLSRTKSLSCNSYIPSFQTSTDCLRRRLHLGTCTNVTSLQTSHCGLFNLKPTSSNSLNHLFLSDIHSELSR